MCTYSWTLSQTANGWVAPSLSQTFTTMLWKTFSQTGMWCHPCMHEKLPVSLLGSVSFLLNTAAYNIQLWLLFELEESPGGCLCLFTWTWSAPQCYIHWNNQLIVADIYSYQALAGLQQPSVCAGYGGVPQVTVCHVVTHLYCTQASKGRGDCDRG